MAMSSISSMESSGIVGSEAVEHGRATVICRDLQNGMAGVVWRRRQRDARGCRIKIEIDAAHYGCNYGEKKTCCEETRGQLGSQRDRQHVEGHTTHHARDSFWVARYNAFGWCCVRVRRSLIAILITVITSEGPSGPGRGVARRRIEESHTRRCRVEG